MQKVPKMMPKGLSEFPRKSRKSALRRLMATQGRSWRSTPKGPPRHSKAPKRTSKDPKKSPKAPPNDFKNTPKEPLGSAKASKRHPKMLPERHTKQTKTQNGKSMQPSSRQQLQRRNFQTTLRRQSPHPAECEERSAAPPGSAC